MPSHDHARFTQYLSHFPRFRPSENTRNGSPTAMSVTTTSSAVTSSRMNANPADRVDSSEIEVAVVRASKDVECARMLGKSATGTSHSWTISNSTLQTLPMSVDTIGGGISNATTCQINSNTTTINGIVINGDAAKLHRTSGEPTKLIIRNPSTDVANDSNQRRVNCQSSSDENRSSGHASMSDTGNGSSSPGCGNNNRGSATMLDPLDEDRLACRSAANLPIEQIHELAIRSAGTSSTYSSLSAEESDSSVPAQNLDRYSSLETVNTNVTTADSIVWIDNHNRLVELAHTPWNQQCILRVIAAGRCREHISTEIIPRLSYLLQVRFRHSTALSPTFLPSPSRW